MLRAQLMEAPTWFTPDQAAELRSKADALYAAGQYSEAEQLFGLLVAWRFEPAWCRFQWGRIAVRLGRWDEAIERLDQAIDTETPNSWAYFERGQAHLERLGGQAAALSDFLRFVDSAPAALAPAHFDILARAAHGAFDRKEYVEAEKLYTFITSNGEGGYICKLRCADLLQLRGKARQAISLLDSQRGRPDYDYWGDYISGLAYSKIRDHALAVDYFEKALVAAPGHLPFWERLLQELEATGAVSKIWLYQKHLASLPLDSQAKIIALVRLQERDLPRFRKAYSALSANDRPAVNERLCKLIYRLAREQHLRAIEQLISATTAVESRFLDLICAALTAYCAQKDWAAAKSLMGRAQSQWDPITDEKFLTCALQYYSYTMDYDSAFSVVRRWPQGSRISQEANGLIAALYAAVGRWDDVLLFLKEQIAAGQTAMDELLCEAVARAARHTGRQAEVCDLLSSMDDEEKPKPLKNLLSQLIEEQHWLAALGSPLSAGFQARYPLDALEGFRRERIAILTRSFSPKRSPSEHRTIYLCADANYLIGACVSLYSLLRNNIGLGGNVFLRVYVEEETLDVAVRVFGAIAKAFAKEIVVVSAATLVKAGVQFRTGWGLFTPGHGLSAAAYHRIYAARQLLHEGVGGRALYLDADTVVTRGIEEILDVDLNGAPLGARKELPLPEIFHAADKLGLHRDRYFNSGVLLFDLSHPDLTNSLDQAIEISLTYPDRLTFVDQCALNLAFSDRVQLLPSTYNHFLRQRDRPEVFVQDPTVIHFLDRPKPWDPMYRTPNCVRWLKEFVSLGDIAGAEQLGELAALSLRPREPTPHHSA